MDDEPETEARNSYNVRHPEKDRLANLGYLIGLGLVVAAIAFIWHWVSQLTDL